MQEPFLINSPRRRRRRRHRPGCRCAVHGGRRRRSRRRRNPDLMLANPRRRRRRGRRRYGRRRYRRNPRGLPGLGQLRGMAPKVGWGAVGVLGTEVVPGFAARFFPRLMAFGPMGTIAVKAGAGLATAFVVRRFVGRSQGNAAAVGALLAVAMDPIRAWVLPMLTGLVPAETAPVGAYLPGMGAYLPENGGMGYLGPGQTVQGFGDYEDVDRLSADERL